MIYEVKTRNHLFNPKPSWRSKMTLSSLNIYKEALSLGFEVKVVSLWLFSNWDYDFDIDDFEEAAYSIDKPKLYDKK